MKPSDRIHSIMLENIKKDADKFSQSSSTPSYLPQAILKYLDEEYIKAHCLCGQGLENGGLRMDIVCLIHDDQKNIT